MRTKDQRISRVSETLREFGIVNSHDQILDRFKILVERYKSRRRDESKRPKVRERKATLKKWRKVIDEIEQYYFFTTGERVSVKDDRSRYDGGYLDIEPLIKAQTAGHKWKGSIPSEIPDSSFATLVTLRAAFNFEERNLPGKGGATDFPLLKLIIDLCLLCGDCALKITSSKNGCLAKLFEEALKCADPGDAKKRDIAESLRHYLPKAKRFIRKTETGILASGGTLAPPRFCPD